MFVLPRERGGGRHQSHFGFRGDGVSIETPEMGDESCYDPETEQSCRVELVVDLADRCIDSSSKFKISAYVHKTSVGYGKDFISQTKPVATRWRMIPWAQLQGCGAS